MTATIYPINHLFTAKGPLELKASSNVRAMLSAQRYAEMDYFQNKPCNADFWNIHSGVQWYVFDSYYKIRFDELMHASGYGGSAA